MDWLRDLFGSNKPVIGVVHLLPLPGSPRYGGSVEAVYLTARRSAAALWDAGFNGLMFENFGDVPFHATEVEPHVVGIVSSLVRENVERGPVGVNLLRNAARDALAAAFAGGGHFVRINVHVGAAVTDQGLIQGTADDTLRYRRLLGSDVRIFADIHVKHAAPLVARDPALEARDAAERGMADAIIVTGSRTGEPTDLAMARHCKEAIASVPLFVGSGAQPSTAAGILAVADGIIVGTCLERTPGDIDPHRAREFMAAARS